MLTFFDVNIVRYKPYYKHKTTLSYDLLHEINGKNNGGVKASVYYFIEKMTQIRDEKKGSFCVHLTSLLAPIESLHHHICP